MCVQEAERLQEVSKFPIYYTYSWSHVYAAACVIMNHEVDGEERCATMHCGACILGRVLPFTSWTCSNCMQLEWVE